MRLRWVMFVIGAGLLAATGTQAWLLLQQQKVQVEERVEAEAEHLRIELELELTEQVQALSRFAERWSETSELSPAIERDAESYVRHGVVNAGIANLDGSGEVLWLVSHDSSFPAILDRCRQSHHPGRTRSDPGKPYFKSIAQDSEVYHVLHIPTRSPTDRSHRIAALIRTRAFLTEVLAPFQRMGFAVQIEDGPHSLLDTRETRTSGSAHELTIEKYGLSWRLRVEPTEALVTELTSRWPFVPLAGGLLLALFLALTVALLERRRSEANLRHIVESTPDGLLLVDAKSIIRRANNAAARFVGYDSKELVGMSMARLMPERLLPPDGRQPAEAYLADPSLYEEPDHLVAVHRDGTEIPVEVEFSVLRLEGHRHILISFRDIRERLAAEEALRESERQFRRAVDHAPIPTLIHAEDGEIVHLSRSWLTRSGFAPEAFETVEDWIRLSCCPNTDPEERLAVIQETYEIEQAKDLGEHCVQRADGTCRTWHFHTAPIGRTSDGRRLISTMALDVTEQKGALRALRKSEEEFRIAFESAPIGISLIRPQEGILRVNQALCESLGYKEEELVGKSVAFITAPEDVAKSRELVEKTWSGEGPDGFDLEKKYLRKNGRIMWGRTHVTLVRDDKDRPLHFIAQVEDITEKQQAAEALVRKNRDLETLLHVMSHDLKEPLRSIENFSSMVLDDYGEGIPDRGRDFLNRVVRASSRMRRLIEELKKLNRAREIALPTDEVVPGNDIAERAVARLEHRIEETQATIRISPDLPGICADPIWATEALYNLLTNALKFTVDNRPPEIDIGPCRTGEGTVGFAVRDRGPGVPPDIRDRIFDLFQRGVGRNVEGTGSGLAIVRQIAERHGGSAWVEEREGGGASFFVTFARAEHPKSKPTVTAEA